MASNSASIHIAHIAKGRGGNVNVAKVGVAKVQSAKGLGAKVHVLGIRARRIDLAKILELPKPKTELPKIHLLRIQGPDRSMVAAGRRAPPRISLPVL